MVLLDNLARIAEIEFSDIVDATEIMETKLRIMLSTVALWMFGCLRNLPTGLASTGSTRLPTFLIVTITFLIPNGVMFLLSPITSIMALKIMWLILPDLLKISWKALEIL